LAFFLVGAVREPPAAIMANRKIVAVARGRMKRKNFTTKAQRHEGSDNGTDTSRS